MEYKYEFGKTKKDEVVHAYIIENDNGLRAEFLDFGCILRQLWVPTAEGSLVNIVFGLDSVDAYENDKCYFGAFVGRFANRIKDAKFELNGEEIQLVPNDGPNHLHGVLSKTLFTGEEYKAKTLFEAMKGIVFRYRSPEGEDGLPGNVDIKVTYYLDDDNVLHMDYEAESDKDTILNFTNHSYFNLGADQLLCVNADQVLEAGNDIIPTGRILNVEDTDLDLRKAVNVEFNAPKLGFFDHCYVLRHNGESHNEKYGNVDSIGDAYLYSPSREIGLEFFTSEPAIQVYSGNPVGVALEPEMYPCGPNFPDFPSCLVKAGEKRIWKNSIKINVKL